MKTNPPEDNLDPKDWEEFRALSHRMVDDMIDYLKYIKSTPIWSPIPSDTKNKFNSPLPLYPQDVHSIYSEFKENILPFNKGNVHPRFFSWVQGTGTPLGMMADMLASGMNPNVAIGEHSAMYVEQQVINWSKEMMGFSKDASGILLSGGTMANITGLTIARNTSTNQIVRKKGLKAMEQQLTMYCSEEAHSCLQKGVEIIGIGNEFLRKIPCDENFKMRLDLLKLAIEKDKKEGYFPCCIIGNIGTVNTGAIDNIQGLIDVAKENNIWLHIDGAYGASVLTLEEYHEIKTLMKYTDSLAFDFHKWFYVPYEVGCLLVNNREAHRKSFNLQPSYLISHNRGLAAGPDPITNYGFELSRGFKALKVWMSLKEHGIEKYKCLIRQNIGQAKYLENLLQEESIFQILTPATLNILCFRFFDVKLKNDLNEINKEILMQLHEKAIATPSYTIIDGIYYIRVAITNHRSNNADFQALVKGCKEIIKGLGY